MIDRQKVLDSYIPGEMKLSDLAEQFGCTASNIARILRSAGISPVDPRSIDWPKEQMLAWYESGMTVEEIASRLGKHRVTTNKALRRFGAKMRRRGPKSGELHPGWRGGLLTDKHGYVLRYAPEHPDSNLNGYARQHRLVAEELLGRPLARGEVVHHKNGDRADNSAENLQVFSCNADHLRHELTGKVPNWTEDGRKRIAEGVLKSHRSRASRRLLTRNVPLLPEMTRRSAS